MNISVYISSCSCEDIFSILKKQILQKSPSEKAAII